MLTIAMATYNGQAYIEEQVESIRAQTFADWQLVISDDSSIDRTWETLNSLAAKDKRIHLMNRDGRRLGAKLNFGRAASFAARLGAKYLAFADQDDVWYTTKLESQLSYMQLLERRNGRNQPILIHTDAEVTDESLHTLAPSVHRHNSQHQDHENSVSHLLLHNSVHGCTTLSNCALLNLALPLPLHAVDHDWWFALCAAAQGTVGYLPEATLKYRQHGSNCVGAQRMGLLSTMRRSLQARQLWQRGMAKFLNALQQTQTLLARIGESGETQVPGALQLEKFRETMCHNNSRVRRVQELHRRQLIQVHWLRRLVSYARVFSLTNADVHRAFSVGHAGVIQDQNASAA